jgi:aldose 1-epimerase
MIIIFYNLYLMDIKKEVYGKTKDNKEVYLFSLQNNNGVTVKITNYGGIITYISVPDKSGNFGNIVLGFDNPMEYISEKYLKVCPYLGAIIGRYGNRIANGKFTVDSKEYTLVKNNGPNHLHGGTLGFDKVIWEAKENTTSDTSVLALHYYSPDMEEGYPGNLDVNVIYSLTNQNEIKIEYDAVTDKACPINLTHHSYFNLNCVKRDVLEHELYLNADKYTIADNALIPTGEIIDVADSPLDFTNPCKIGDNIYLLENGYDHNYVINKTNITELTFAARVSEPLTGRAMEMYTTEPGVQFYSGNFLDGSLGNAKGKTFNKHYGFCLEAQHYPDSPNKQQFPSTILNPGEKYSQTTIYKFL